MGCYINPKTMSKEDWLNKFATPHPGPVPVSPDVLPICLVDNGMFTAAAVAYDQREADAFNLPSDRRPKFWYSAKRADLYEVSDLKNYERTN